MEETARLLPGANDARKQIAIALAAQHGHVDVVRLLLDAGVDPSRYNPDGYQRKEKVAAVTKCPTCHMEVALVAETEEWEERDDATWEHVGWGPAAGVCCGNLIVEFPNSYEVYPLPGRRTGQDPG